MCSQKEPDGPAGGKQVAAQTYADGTTFVGETVKAFQGRQAIKKLRKISTRAVAQPTPTVAGSPKPKVWRETGLAGKTFAIDGVKHTIVEDGFHITYDTRLSEFTTKIKSRQHLLVRVGDCPQPVNMTRFEVMRVLRDDGGVEEAHVMMPRGYHIDKPRYMRLDTEARYTDDESERVWWTNRNGKMSRG
jgi:hypothetical protein